MQFLCSGQNKKKIHQNNKFNFKKHKKDTQSRYYNAMDNDKSSEKRKFQIFSHSQSKVFYAYFDSIMNNTER